MSTGSTEMGMLEKINQKTKSIKEVFAHDMSTEDKESLQSMLMEAKEEKRQILKSHLYDLKAKYGLKSNDVFVEETTPSPQPPTNPQLCKGQCLNQGTPR